MGAVPCECPAFCFWCAQHAMTEATESFKSLQEAAMATAKQMVYLDMLAKELGIIEHGAWNLLSVDSASAKIEEYKAAKQAMQGGLWDERIENMKEAGVKPWVKGKETVVGEIVGTKWVDSNYGVTLKVRVRDEDGRILYLTAPKFVDGSGSVEDLVGRQVSVKATISPTNPEDPFFAVGRYPTWNKVR